MELKPKNRRVVITGMGIVSPIGSDLHSFWKAAIAGQSGIITNNLCDVSDLSSQVAGIVQDFEPMDWLENRKDLRKTDRFVQMALAASTMAVNDAGITISSAIADRAGVYIGAGIGGLSTICDQNAILLEKGPRRVSPFLIPMAIINLAAGQVSIRLGAKGPNAASATACAAGSHAIGDAFRLIQNGEADIMIAGGAEAAICRLSIAGFCSMRALSTRNDEPQKASRPFERDRDGFVIGEGSGILILEELEFALARGAKNIYAEVVGYGQSGDAFHITAPSEDGDGAARCMQAALDDASLQPDTIDYINAHGTSTQINDLTETLAIKEIFKDHAYKLKISSTKSMVGHSLGGAGGIEAIAATLSLYHQEIHPTINFENTDPQLDLDYVPNISIKKPLYHVMSNSFGFGGTNACLILKKFQD